jgi:hypothetical protein
MTVKWEANKEEEHGKLIFSQGDLTVEVFVDRYDITSFRKELLECLEELQKVLDE